MTRNYEEIIQKNEEKALSRLKELDRKVKVEKTLEKVVGTDTLDIVRLAVTVAGGIITVASFLWFLDAYQGPNEALPTMQIAAIVGGLVVLSYGVSLRRKG